MDTLINKIAITNQTDVSSAVWSWLFTTYFTNPVFLGAVLFVIVVTEVIKRNFLQYINASNKWYPWIALIVSFFATIFTTQFTETKNYIFNLILITCFIDIIYTFIGSKLIDFLLNYKFRKENGNGN